MKVVRLVEILKKDWLENNRLREDVLTKNNYGIVFRKLTDSYFLCYNGDFQEEQEPTFVGGIRLLAQYNFKNLEDLRFCSQEIIDCVKEIESEVRCPHCGVSLQQNMYISAVGHVNFKWNIDTECFELALLETDTWASVVCNECSGQLDWNKEIMELFKERTLEFEVSKDGQIKIKESK